MIARSRTDGVRFGLKGRTTPTYDSRSLEMR